MVTRAIAVVVVVASCAKPAVGPGTVRADRQGMSLEVIVLDDYATRESCANVPPHQIEVSLDGRVVATVSVPCATTVRAPPPQFAAPAVGVRAGKHVIRVHDVGTGVENERALELPGDDPAATKLPVWANEGELDIQGLRAQMK